jgi:mannosyltransferase OCH1-like enzyme
MLDIVQGLWIGPDLSDMERLSLLSYLRNGHDFLLYVYDNPTNVPEGVVLKDAASILPRSMIFQYRDHKSYAGFANYFRYKLLLEHGGYWSDLDTVCLSPLDFDGAYVFSSEDDHGRTKVNNALTKVPPGSRLMEAAWRICQGSDPAQIAWGETGPGLLNRLVREQGLEGYVQEPGVFCPIHFRQWVSVLDPQRQFRFGPETRAIHLWQEMWRRAEQPKDYSYDKDCLYEQLKAKYLESDKGGRGGSDSCL